MRTLKIIIAVITAIMATLNAIGWTYMPNYWLFGLAFVAFTLTTGILCGNILRGAAPNRGVPVQVHSCARCSQDHQMYFVTFAYHPVTSQDAVEFTHWGMCPVLNEPVLMRIVNTETKHAENY